jgi:imidazolonepropionase-like amidohydrolase
MRVSTPARRRALLTLACGLAPRAWAQTPATPAAQASGVLFENVRIFDGLADRLSAPTNVLVVGRQIQTISGAPIADPPETRVTRIAGGGRTLMPGLIDAHTHLMFSTVPQLALLTADIGFVQIAAGKGATEMLLRGFTSARDLGGPVFGLKRAIDAGVIPGPRIWPAGAFVSQSGGHGDFRLPSDMPARPGDFTYGERIGGSAIADDPDTVRKRVREQLALGASHIKLMAGGGVSSNFDPLDVTQYSVPEIRAAVEAAENWGTYVTVHAYTPRAVRQAIEAGVKCVDHGNLLDDATAALMAEKGVWWSLQPFLDDRPSPFAEGTPNRIKQLRMYSGTDAAYAAAKKHKIKTAWGTDILFSASEAAAQGRQLAKMTRWYTPAEALRMATSGNAQLLALSGERSPYAGQLGVVKEGALADLLLVDGDPLADLALVADAAKNFVVIMKDGQVYKNALKP